MRGAIRFSQFSSGSWQEFYYHHNPLYPAGKKLRDFTAEEWKALRIGPDGPLIMEHAYNNTGQASKFPYEGVVPRFNRLYLNRDISGLKKSVQEEALFFMRRCPCPACVGSGLNPKVLAARINGYNIPDYYAMQVSQLLPVLEAVDDPLGRSIAGQIFACLRRMVQVGLGYLSLSWRTDTLSSGEVQRLKLAGELNQSGNIYILNEPSTGLHEKDAALLPKLLRRLVEQENTVVIVEHRLSLIAAADWIIDMGPGSGSAGGEVVYAGPRRACRTAPRRKPGSIF